ncbi:MAG TPA: adenylate/guanylate cyclase domain-containing protein [Gaiellaceae bacterium]|nr:adenylate/guanylate cyclase domain-containing protein [Gaiellaceae bacterium]
MPDCPSCGRANADDARFCSACGTALTAAEPAREQRKVVTVLFCDLVGSTALGESTDPEALRARMRRYFEDLRVILERHGGTVEKFVGDAVMAVFGIPVSHEDDALRAVRAAAEMRAAIGEHGLEARIGINTGEVVVGGEGETLVTGDAVNVAARLEQAAPSGEILIGADTHQLVRDAVRVESVEPLALKGKSEPVAAFRLLEVFSDAAPLARHPETPLVGRERERQRLWRAYEDAAADSSCQLFTLLGPAGIGKSRLVADFVERVGESADVLRGRCLSYGEGITYWPLVEILVAIGVEPDAVIGTSPPETQLAFRRLLETRAAERPQVVVIDDLQWAEPVFVDLVEHVADLSRDAPIFLLCIARTELLDVRPEWGGGKLNATSLLLEPLDAGQCAELMGLLATSAGIDDDLRERITVASAGNPLFVEEMLAMVREHGGGGEIAVPPTIHALLQARIDSLDGDVRVVMERGAVEGEVFHRGTVAELAPDPVRPDVSTHLATLVRKELIRSTSPMLPQDEGFRFRHLLIRDAAYESLPKATRAELHERFADWLAQHDLVESDEIVGYHVAQAHRYRAELDAGDARLDELARRASSHLADAGRGALDRGDFNAGRSLFGRAAALLPEKDETRLAIGLELSGALSETSADEAWRLMSEAHEADDPQTRGRAMALMASWALTGSQNWPAEKRSAWRTESRDILEDVGDDYGLALHWWGIGIEAWFRLRGLDAAEAFERALDHLERSGRPQDRLGLMIRHQLLSSYFFSPTPVDEAIDRLRALRAGEHGLLARAWEQTVLARLASMKGDFDGPRKLVRDARRAYLDAGLLVSGAAIALSESGIERRAGDYEAAERALREGLVILEDLDETSYRPTLAVILASVLYEQGQFDEVQEWCELARSTSGADDLVNFIYIDALSACLLARRGSHDGAKVLALTALRRIEGIEHNETQINTYRFVAEVFALASDPDAALDYAQRAVALALAKGDVTIAERTRENLARVGIEVA